MLFALNHGGDTLICSRSSLYGNVLYIFQISRTTQITPLLTKRSALKSVIMCFRETSFCNTINHAFALFYDSFNNIGDVTTYHLFCSISYLENPESISFISFHSFSFNSHALSNAFCLKDILSRDKNARIICIHSSHRHKFIAAKKQKLDCCFDYAYSLQYFR